MWRRLRTAWCELTGGHKLWVAPAWRGDEAIGARVHCLRCRYRTDWFNVRRSEFEESDGEPDWSKLAARQD